MCIHVSHQNNFWINHVSRGRIKKGALNSKSYCGPQAAFVDSFDFIYVDVQHLI